MPTPDNVVVLVPSDAHGGISVCDLSQFAAAIIDGQSVDDAAALSEIDSWDPQGEHALEHLTRIRALNETGDPAAYWEFDTKEERG